MTNMLGAMGRNGDTMMAHVTPGDVVIPRAVVLQNPEFLTKLKKAMQDQGGDYRSHIVGSGYENINPDTGAPGFGWLSKVWNHVTKPIKEVSHGISSGNLGDVVTAGAPAALKNMMGPWVGATPADTGASAGAATASSNLGNVDTPFVAKRGNEPTKPYDLFNRDVGGQMFGSLDPMQQRSYLATQGTQGGGIGDEDKNYYLGLLQRNLIDESGQMGNMNSALLPVERNYLSRLGLPTDNTNDFFQALQS